MRDKSFLNLAMGQHSILILLLFFTHRFFTLSPYEEEGEEEA